MTLLAKTCNRARTPWIIGQGLETATIAMKNLGLETLSLKGTDKDNCWQSQADIPSLKAFLARSNRDSQKKKSPDEKPEWIITPLTQQLLQTMKTQEHFKEVVM
jgi:hypothetical protein